MTRKGNYILRKSFVIWFLWIFNLAIFQVSYDNSIITDVMLGEWTMNNLMMIVSYIWVMFWFGWVAWEFQKGKVKLW